MGSLSGGATFSDEENLSSFRVNSNAVVLVGSCAQGMLAYTSEPILKVYPEYAPGGMTEMLIVYEYFAGAVL